MSVLKRKEHCVWKCVKFSRDIDLCLVKSLSNLAYSSDYCVSPILHNEMFKWGFIGTRQRVWGITFQMS